MIEGGEGSRANFLTPAAYRAFERTREERKGYAAGLVDEDRVVNNLLSSQPLAFNFFGELKVDLDLATQVARLWEPRLESVTEVRFEFAPEENYTGDHSAFDVAFLGRGRDGLGLVGLEVKYTDSFSPKEYDREEYRRLFERSRAGFARPYEEYIRGRFNQLFRNQLIAESLKLEKGYGFVTTGLFCHPADPQALQVGEEFRDMLIGGEERFKLLTYQGYLESLQRMNLSWEQRKWTMLLWARYCATELSEAVRGPRL
jgi:hypothetical protein